jgi:hypothetical protein
MRPSGLALLIVLPIVPLQAQVAAPDSGIRVRVTFSEAGASRQVTGTLIFLDADSLAVRVAAPSTGSTTRTAPATQPVLLARSQVTRLEVSTGRHSSAGMGALIGAGIGIVGGVAVGLAGQCNGNEVGWTFCLDSQGYTVGFGAVFGALGAGLGAIVGALTHHETWRSVEQPPAVGIILHPEGDRVAAGLSIRF